jgi:hypothetical protein
MDRRKNRNLFDDNSDEGDEEYVPSNTAVAGEALVEKNEEMAVT